MHRQVVVEGFAEAGEVSSDRFLGDGRLYRSVGAMVHDCWEFYTIRIQPGIGFARQLDGREDTVLLIALDFAM